MAKYKVTRKNQQLFIKSRLERGESLNDREFGMLSDRLYYGLMRPTSAGERNILYTAPDGISLEKYFASGISAKEACLIIAQTAEATKEVLRRGCSLDNMLLDYKYVFINSMTKKIHIIYQPVIGTKNKYNIFSFFYGMVPYIRLASEADDRRLKELVGSLKRMQYYHPDEVENVIYRFYPDVQRQVGRQGTGSGRMSTSSGRMTDTDKPRENGPNVRYGRAEMPFSGYQRMPATAQVTEEEKPTGLLGEEETGLLEGEEETGLLEEEEETGLLEEEEETGLLEEEEETGLLEEEEETGLLEEEDGTTVLETPRSAYIVRLINYEVAEVKKTPFWIGREMYYVDYFIGNNDKISRRHASITTENDGFFLMDNDSKNGTYLNGMRVEPGQRCLLEEGSRFIVANEEFEFHIY